MSPKCVSIEIELTIAKISCPGVWLCSNGDVSLQLSMLDSIIQTNLQQPKFPIVFGEKFMFYQNFPNVYRLNDLRRHLQYEWLHAELVQWKNYDECILLADFQSTLADLLYASPTVRCQHDYTDMDLLMEPTVMFPGILSPKLEIKIEATIKNDSKNISLNNFRMPTTKSVCHTVKYSQAQQQRETNIEYKSKRPPFRYKKPEDNLIVRTNPTKVSPDNFSQMEKILSAVRGNVMEKSSTIPKLSNKSKTSFVRKVSFPPDDYHSPQKCSTCSTYEIIFPKSKQLQLNSCTSKTSCSCCCSIKKLTKCPCNHHHFETSLTNLLHEKYKQATEASRVTFEDCQSNCHTCRC